MRVVVRDPSTGMLRTAVWAAVVTLLPLEVNVKVVGETAVMVNGPALVKPDPPVGSRILWPTTNA